MPSSEVALCALLLISTLGNPAETGSQSLRSAGRGTARAEDAQGTPTQSHISPSILLYEDNTKVGAALLVQQMRAGTVQLRGGGGQGEEGGGGQGEDVAMVDSEAMVDDRCSEDASSDAPNLDVGATQLARALW